MNSFKIGGFDSSTTFLVVEDIQVEPLTPKQSTLSLKERDGIIDFSFSNQYNRLIFDERVITMKCIYRYNSINDMYNKINSIYGAIYNNVKGELELSTTPGVKWNACLLNIQKQEITGNSTGRIVIQYRVEPFSHSEQEIIVNQSLSGSTSLTVNNPGTATSNKHLISLTNIKGNTGGIFIQKPDGTFIECSKIFNDGDNLVIDFTNFEILVNGDPVENLEWDGDFFELPSGNMPIEIDFSGTATMKWYLVPQYFYSKNS